MSSVKPFLGAVACVLLAGCSGQGTEDSVGDVEAEIRRCADGPTVPGIDVSEYQETVDWAAVRQSGKRFAFVRISDGTRHPDDYFARNWAGAKAAGLVRGAYQFFRPQQDALAQANLVVQKLGRLGPGDLPAVLDVESADGASDATIVAGMRTWLSRVEEGTGKKPIIYTSIGFFGGVSGGSAFGNHLLWVANYGVSCPDVPSPWRRWTFWQQTDTGRTPGVQGPMDLNVFNGTMADLEALAGGDGEVADAYAPIEVYWNRTESGAYELRALAPEAVVKVEYWVDGYAIGSAERGPGNFPTSYSFTAEGSERRFEARGFDASGKRVALGVGLLDVTAGTAVYVRQLGDKLYEIGLERAVADIAAIEVRADGILLEDAVVGSPRSGRLAVRSRFTQLGSRKFEIRTFNADGSPRGSLYRTFTLR